MGRTGGCHSAIMNRKSQNRDKEHGRRRRSSRKTLVPVSGRSTQGGSLLRGEIREGLPDRRCSIIHMDTPYCVRCGTVVIIVVVCVYVCMYAKGEWIFFPDRE